MGLGVSGRGTWTNRKTGFVPRRSGRANLAADAAIVVMLSEDGLRWIEVQRWRRLGFFSRGGAPIHRDFQPCQPPCDIAKHGISNSKISIHTTDAELRCQIECVNQSVNFHVIGAQR